ncbi:MAG TPA: PAS domain-containing protein [Rhizomicrobium sp.]|nr:PAS domain-containing protein [Rhizomicrobium sp.]
MTSTSEDGATIRSRLPQFEFEAVFDRTPHLYLVLDPSFTIVAANAAYCAATMTEHDAILGRAFFEVFPDNPGDYSADGVANLRASLLKVLKTREADRMDVQKYDIRTRDTGAFQERYWSPVNVPVMGSDGYVRWVIHSVEDVTEIMSLRAETAAQRSDAASQRLLVQLRETKRALAARDSENAELREMLRRQPRN